MSGTFVLGSPVQFGDPYAVLASSGLSLGDSDKASIITGSDNPQSVAQDGEPGSIYMCSSNSTIYVKADSGVSTNWQLVQAGVPIVNGVTASAPLLSSGGNNPDISIPVATAIANGYLSSADWTTFNSKQAPGSYITALTGDVTASGPGSAAASIADATVSGKLLTGLNTALTGAVSASDSILQAFGRAQHAINTLSVFSYSADLIHPQDYTYVLDEASAFAQTINTLSIKTSSGTCTVAIQINGVSVTGLSAVAASSVQAVATASALNTVAANDRITLVVSSNSFGVDLSFTLKTTRSF